MRCSAWVSLGAAALIAACSSSTSPKPSLAGTWHIAVQGSLTSGALSPETLSVTVTQVKADSYTVSMPGVAWSVGPLLFDSGAVAGVFADTSQFGFGEFPTNRTQHCQFIQFFGTKNQGLDTLGSAYVELFNSDTSVGGYCTSVAQGVVTIHK